MKILSLLSSASPTCVRTKGWSGGSLKQSKGKFRLTPLCKGGIWRNLIGREGNESRTKGKKTELRWNYYKVKQGKNTSFTGTGELVCTRLTLISTSSKYSGKYEETVTTTVETGSEAPRSTVKAEADTIRNAEQKQLCLDTSHLDPLTWPTLWREREHIKIISNKL